MNESRAQHSHPGLAKNLLGVGFWGCGGAGCWWWECLELYFGYGTLHEGVLLKIGYISGLACDVAWVSNLLGLSDPEAPCLCQECLMQQQLDAVHV